MEPSTFGTRIGFLLWLKHLSDGQPASYKEVGDAIGRTGVTVSAWRDFAEPPTDYRLHEPLSRYFGASAKWIVDGEGEPPQPELWKIWVKMRRVRHAAPTGQDALTAAKDQKDQRRKRG